MALNKKTPIQITKFLNSNLHKFDNPACYYGDEPNAVRWSPEQWDNARLRFVLSSSLDYVQALGNLSIPLLYQLSTEYNSVDRVTERNYSPSTRKELKLFEKNSVPPFGLETRHCLSDFDVIGFSISYTPFWFNCVKSLTLAGIPIRWRDRQYSKERQPLIIAGGLNYGNPWFMAPVVDAVWCGEAEGAMGLNSFLDDLADYKEDGAFYDGRVNMLHSLAIKYNCLFVPRFYEVTHENRGGTWHVTGWTNRHGDLPHRVIKHIVSDLNTVLPCTNPPVPYCRPAKGMGTIQVSRGCTYHCSFCTATYREAPYRERSEVNCINAFQDNLINTGSIKVAPQCLEFGTYSRKKSLMKHLFENVSSKCNMPALRMDVFAEDRDYGNVVRRIGNKKNVTIAIEAASQRLRDSINKGITEKNIIEAFTNAVAAGFKQVKFYAICNLPGETDKDYEELYQLMVKLDTIRRQAGSGMRTRLSWKPLTIQAWTPFQWQACRVQSSGGSAISKRLKEELNIGINIGKEIRDSLGNFMQLAELADDIAGEALTDTIEESGAIIFGSLPKEVYGTLKEALGRWGRTLEDYYREKSFDEVFAWDIIDILISKKWLIKMAEKSRNRILLDKPSRDGFLGKFGSCLTKCSGCGACDTNNAKSQMKEIASHKDIHIDLSGLILKSTEVKHRFYVEGWIDASKSYADIEFWRFAIRRACNKNGLEQTDTNIKLNFKKIRTIKPWFAGKVYFELDLGKSTLLSKEEILQSMNAHLISYGMTLIQMQEVLPTQSMHTNPPEANLWTLEIDRPANQLKVEVYRALTNDYTKLLYKVREYRIGLVSTEINLREVLYDAKVSINGSKVELQMLLSPSISPYDAAKSVLQDRVDVYRYIAVNQGTLSNVLSPSSLVDCCSVCGTPIPHTPLGLLSKDMCAFHYLERVNDK